MKFNITGQHVDLGDSFKTHIHSHLEDICNRYFDNTISAAVNISKDSSTFSATIRVNEGTGNKVVIISEADDHDPYKAFDKALHKVQKQLLKYKERIKRHRNDKDALLVEASKFTFSSLADDHDHLQDVPVIIAETSMPIERLTVADAVMRMEMLNLPAMMFVNKKSGQVNMVYYRRDGNITWVDTPQGAI